MRLIFTILLCFALGATTAQQNAYYKVDSASYAQYLHGDVDGLKKTLKLAKKNDIDYYYLRMRAGIVFYSRGNFEKASKHFSRALHYFPADTLAAEYLYNAYAANGRSFEANKVATKLKNSQQQRLGTKPKAVQSISLFGGYGLSNNKAQNGNTPPWANGAVFGETRALNNFGFGQLSMVNNLGPSIKLISAYTYFNLQNTYRVQGPLIDSSYNYTTQQHDVYLSPVVYLGKGWSIAPAMHFANYAFTSYLREYYTGAPKDVLLNVNTTLLYLGAAVNYRTNFVGINAAAGTSKISTSPRFYHGSVGLLYYPLGNNKLYGSTTGLWLNDSIGNYFAFSQKLGVKLAKILWFEAGFTTGQLRYFAEDNGFTYYNIPDEISMKLSASLNLYLSRHVNITIGYSYMQRQGEITRSFGPNYTEYLTTNYTNHLISTGITFTP